MRASEVAAKLLRIAEEYNDPHVYAYPKSLVDSMLSVQAVEPESVDVVDLNTGTLERHVCLIVGLRLSETEVGKRLLAEYYCCPKCLSIATTLSGNSDEGTYECLSCGARGEAKDLVYAEEGVATSKSKGI